jgi:peptidoglycan/LPS O-acetylase OafA/YrhL
MMTRSAGIDALRGIFALLVLAAHAYDIAKSLVALPSRWRALLDNSLSKGNYWVTGFFSIASKVLA